MIASSAWVSPSAVRMPCGTMRSIALVLFCCAACYGGFEPYRWQDSCTCQLADGGIFGRDFSWFACDERSVPAMIDVLSGKKTCT